MTITQTPDAATVATIQAGMRPDLFLTSDADMEPYGRDWTGDHRGVPLAVARPRSTRELADLMARCTAARLPVVPQGGLTGLVGAANT